MSDRQQYDRLAELLRRAYWATHEEARMFSVPDHQQATILQHLRLRVIPAEFIAENFEVHLQRTTAATSSPVSSTKQFATELRRFRRLTHPQRASLLQLLFEAEGYVRSEGRWVSPVEGMGEIEAFVFDSQTGQYLIRSGIGVHFLAVVALYDTVRPVELGKRWPLPPAERQRDLMNRMEEMVAGFVIQLPGWSTPFLHLWMREPNIPLAQWQANARRVQDLRLFLVAEHDGQPLPSRSTR